MTEFQDEKNGLRWVIFNLDKDKDNKGTIDKLEKTNTLLNAWKGEDIRTYIANDNSLGDYFYTLLHYFPDSIVEAFAYDKDNNLAGCALISNDALDIYNIDGKQGEPIDNTNLRIEFIVTNPKLRNRGLGTRMALSITENQDIFSNHRDSIGVSATIDTTNEPSKKAFRKSGFLHSPSTSPHFKIFYQRRRTKTQNTTQNTKQTDDVSDTPPSQ